MSNYILPGIFLILGIFYVIFAFVPPPQWAAGLFRIPIIFAILPERLARPVGNFLTGVLMIVVSIWLGSMMIK
jgi:hypothetical protein